MSKDNIHILLSRMLRVLVYGLPNSEIDDADTDIDTGTDIWVDPPPFPSCTRILNTIQYDVMWYRRW
jgi:hypothetical protein